MSKKAASNTYFTAQVKNLLDKLYGRSILKDSFLERAIGYYEFQSFNQDKLDKFSQRISELKAKKDNDKAKRHLVVVESEFLDYKGGLKLESEERHRHLLSICHEIIELTESPSFEETNRKSAQLLGTIQLLSPTEGKRVAEINECHKPLYKAVLCLRLLEKLLSDNGDTTTDPYIREFLQSNNKNKQQGNEKNEGYKRFVENVKIPFLMAALIQDIGNFHPESKQIIKGNDAKINPFKVLAMEERKKLLQVNYRETIKFLVEGIGTAPYIGNSKEEREQTKLIEQNKLLFIKRLLKSAISPKQGIGNLIKVPQIYTSIILSTKDSYNYKLLPKVYQALNQNAEKGICSQVVVDALRMITGDFPQGYGITYIPQDSDGRCGDHYEYAIVTKLYPKDNSRPICRIATRSLQFICHGHDIEIPLSCNLYHPEAAKQFSRLSKERLNEILVRLASNFNERKKLDLLPRCWNAGEYFSMKGHQKLWNKVSQDEDA